LGDAADVINTRWDVTLGCDVTYAASIPTTPSDLQAKGVTFDALAKSFAMPQIAHTEVAFIGTYSFTITPTSPEGNILTAGIKNFDLTILDPCEEP